MSLQPPNPKYVVSRCFLEGTGNRNKEQLRSQEVVMFSGSFDPGLVQVPLEGNEIVLVRAAA